MLFAHPLTFFVTHFVMPLMTAGAVAFVYWLSCDALEGALATKAIVVVASAAALPLLALLVLLFRPKKMNIWLMLAWTFAGAVFLYLAFPVMGDMARKVDSWALGPTPLVLFFSGVMPLIFSGLVHAATAKWSEKRSTDIWLSVFCILIGPAAVYLTAVLEGRIHRFFMDHETSKLAQAILAHILAVGFIVVTALFFTGILRILNKVFKAAREKMEESSARILGALVFALLLPISGLVLNLKIPFPADFANLWTWGLTVFTAAALLLPVPAAPLGLVAFFLRFVVAPFVLYFFLLFLPFLPLAIPAVLLVGTGFLILAPMLLFCYWTRDAARAWKILRGRYPRYMLTSVALAGMLVLPAGFCIDVEMERRDVKTLLEWHTCEDFDGPPAPLPVSKERAVKIMNNINAYTFGAEIPFLSAWRTWRVYDGMYLSDKLRNELNRRILGKKVEDFRDWDERGRNIFAGSFFGFNTARRSSGRGASSPWFDRPRFTDKFSARASFAGENPDDAIFTVTIMPTAIGENQEFCADLSLPPGAWIEGMRLKMTNGVWKTARPSERKAAEWVYNKITEQRLDPSIVTLDSPESGSIRVFPVGAEGREVELKVRLPDIAFSPVLMSIRSGIREERVANPLYPVDLAAPVAKMFVASGADVTVVNKAWLEIHKDGIKPSVPSCDVTVMDADDPELLQKLRRFLRNYKKSITPETLGVLPSFSFISFIGHFKKENAPSEEHPLELAPEKALRWADLAILWRELPGVVTLGDIPASGWFGFETVDGRFVAAALRENSEGALVFARIAGAEELGGPWAEGAKAWELENQSFLKPALDLRRELLDRTRKTGTLTTKSAYIVVENAMQEKGLAQKEMEALNGDKSLDFDESMADKGDAPGFFILLVLITPFLVSVERALARSRWKAL